jgi:hypothetical protein
MMRRIMFRVEVGNQLGKLNTYPQPPGVSLGRPKWPLYGGDGFLPEEALLGQRWLQHAEERARVIQPCTRYLCVATYRHKGSQEWSAKRYQEQ